MNRSLITPAGMSRRHFLTHLAGAGAVAATAQTFTDSLWANAPALKKQNKAVILLWMGGGPSTIDIWDLKPGAETGGPFKPIATAGEAQICEHLPQVAKVMDRLSIVRSMSTREADHSRARYYLHTGYVPNPDIIHPSYGAVVSHELKDQSSALQIPPFVSVGGASEGPGFLGMAYAPFVVDANGEVRNLRSSAKDYQLMDRMRMLETIEKSFVKERRGLAAADHAKVLDKTFALMTSQQMAAFKVGDEPQPARERYGTTNFGNGCLLARRLVEAGVPFVEVDFGGWDNHQNVFRTLENDKLPQLDKAMSALVEDLDQRGLLTNTVVLWMGEFGRTPRVNANVGRDHWARSWSAVLGGAGIKRGAVVGKTSDDGAVVETEPYSSEDLMATVLQALDIPLAKTYTSNNGRPMKIANSGKPIEELFA